MKHYIIDTKILIEDFNAIENLSDNETNRVSIPATVLLELDGLKNDKKIGYIARKAINEIKTCYDKGKITILDQNSNWIDNYNKTSDGKVLCDILNSDLSSEYDNIFLTNDNIFNILAKQTINTKNIKVEQYNSKTEYISDPKRFTGLLNSPVDNKIGAANFFCFDKSKGVLNFHSMDGVRDTHINTNLHEVWKTKSKDKTQHMAFDLLLNDTIDICTIQGSAGFGKSHIALASALYLTLEKKKFEKIIFVKSNVQIGLDLGFLPGNLDEKLLPYNQYIIELLFKLHTLRNAKRVFEGDPKNKKLDDNVFKIMPLNYIRGMNIDNSFVIVDECQNLNRNEIRALLSRMGENVKCVLLGDISQVDAPNLNIDNNALTLVVRNFITKSNYAHIVMSGKFSRGPICDMVLRSEL